MNIEEIQDKLNILLCGHERKNLIVTYDDERGGIDTDLIQKIIEHTFDLD